MKICKLSNWSLPLIFVRPTLMSVIFFKTKTQTYDSRRSNISVFYQPFFLLYWRENNLLNAKISKTLHFWGRNLHFFRFLNGDKFLEKKHPGVVVPCFKCSSKNRLNFLWSYFPVIFLTEERINVETSHLPILKLELIKNT